MVEEESFRGIFATYPHPDTTTGGQLLDQVVGTFLLMLIVCALTDNNNSAPPKGDDLCFEVLTMAVFLHERQLMWMPLFRPL